MAGVGSGESIRWARVQVCRVVIEASIFVEGGAMFQG